MGDHHRPGYHKDRRAALLATGKCGIHHEEDLLSGEARCQRCKDNAAHSKSAAKSAGICVNHRREQRPAIPGKTVCKECLWVKMEEHIARKFGITLEDYARMEYYQNRLCAICHRLDPSGRALAVDHDHETGKVRGLLCMICNHFLGYLEECGISMFTDYLADPPADKVLLPL